MIQNYTSFRTIRILRNQHNNIPYLRKAYGVTKVLKLLDICLYPLVNEESSINNITSDSKRNGNTNYLTKTLYFKPAFEKHK